MYPNIFITIVICTDEEEEVERGNVACPRPHRILEITVKLSDSRAQGSNHYVTLLSFTFQNLEASHVCTCCGSMSS